MKKWPRVPATTPGWSHVGANLRVLSMVLLSLSLSGQAQAQAAVPRPTVTKAMDIIEAVSTRVPVGTDVVFTPRASTGAQALFRSGLQVRVFSLRDSEDKPTPLAKIDGCDVYLSTVFRLEPTPGTGVRFQRLDESWLNLTYSAHSIKDGRYYLVFEQAGPQTEQFRLRSADSASYFETGFKIEVFDNGSVDLAAVTAAYAKRDARLGRLYDEVDNKRLQVPCYSYRRLPAGSGADAAIAEAVLEPCATGPH